MKLLLIPAIFAVAVAIPTHRRPANPGEADSAPESEPVAVRPTIIEKYESIVDPAIPVVPAPIEDQPTPIEARPPPSLVQIILNINVLSSGAPPVGIPRPPRPIPAPEVPLKPEEALEITPVLTDPADSLAEDLSRL